MVPADEHHASSSAKGTQFWRPTPPSYVGDTVEVAVAPTTARYDISIGERLPGTRLRILDRLGDGGGGVVYRGEHIDLQRPLAIKVLRNAAWTAEDRQRFLEEARITSRIDSPYVVDVVDFGELPGGGVWYAMPLLGETTLDRLVADVGPLPPERTIALLRMACKGLAAVHAAGIVHRDVKPQNILIDERAGRDHVSVVDFGIAMASGSRAERVIGTPEYMPREQILGEVLDARTDVYALGCVAYELLTGRRIVENCTVQRALLRHTEGIEPEFREADAVPPALQEIVRRCIAVEPDDRYANTVELEAELCEAQIAIGIGATRDDLEIPAVDANRRSRIAAGFLRPGQRRAAVRSRLAVLASSAAAAALAILVSCPAEPASTRHPLATLPTAHAAPAVELAVVPVPLAPIIASESRNDERVRSAQAKPRRLAPRHDDPDVGATHADLADPAEVDRSSRRRALWSARADAHASPRSPAQRVRIGDALVALGRADRARAHYLRAQHMGSTVAAQRLAELDQHPRRAGKDE